MKSGTDGPSGPTAGAPDEPGDASEPLYDVRPDQIEVLTKAGWEIERASLFDEEGVEGWRWIAPDGREGYEIGSWEYAPTVPNVFLPEVAAFLRANKATPLPQPTPAPE